MLAELRSRDPDLAADLETLLEQQALLAREEFLERGPALPAGGASLAGVTIGAYTLRTQIGQGGMGQVWLAERSDGRYEGRAAVKLLNASLVGREGEERFRREGSLLARLRHPCIAHLIDAGMTTMGQPYLVLEHVDGQPIDAFCDARRLSVEARLRLFLDVLSAVSFAHANLIVHRDLKPPNIFVGKDGRVRLLDFGIAKLLDAEAAGGTLTREGGTALTPEYATPEQLTGGDITTATDVFALGVVLYVLLTGQHPVGAALATPAALVKSIVEKEAPRPSDLVAAAETLPRPALEERAAARGSTPARLRRRLQGDLDNIIARCLKKDPRERYPSVQSMAEDLRRHLTDEPVTARPDSFLYRSVKFVRRHRTGVAAAAMVVAAVLAAVAGVAWQAREARRQRDVAEANLARATAANDFTATLLGMAAPSGRRFNVGELLDQGEALIEKQFAHDDALRAEMLIIIGQEYVLAEHWDKAMPILERAASIAERSNDPALKARALCPLAFVKILNGAREEAQAMMARALEGLPADPQYEQQRAECLIRRSGFGYETGDGEGMIRNAEEAMSILDRSRKATATRTKRIDALGALAYGYYLARRNAEAERTFAEVMRALEQAGRERTALAADTLNNWALVYFQGDIAKAEPLCRRMVELRRSIEGGGSIAPTNTFNLAGVLVELAHYEEARGLLEETIRSAAQRQEKRIQFDAMMALAGLHIESGDLARGAAQLDEMARYESDPMFNRFRRAQLHFYRGQLDQARGMHAAARDHFAGALEIFDAVGAKIAMNVQALIGLARAEGALGHEEAAATAVDRALELASSFVEKGTPSYLVGRSLAARGDLLLASGKVDLGREALRAASEHLGRTLGLEHPETRRVLARISP